MMIKFMILPANGVLCRVELLELQDTLRFRTKAFVNHGVFVCMTIIGIQVGQF